jgi:protein-tyrosine phosphatase
LLFRYVHVSDDVRYMLDKLDFLEHPAFGDGRLGLTSVPGRDMARWETDPLGRDLRGFVGLRTHRIVCLLPSDELAALGAGELPGRAGEKGIAFSQLGIPDGHAPPDPAAFAALVRGALSELRDGRTLVAHCRAGFGRTGTFAACCLVEGGVEADAAIAAVRALRRYAVETRAQEAFVRAYVSSCRG